MTFSHSRLAFSDCFELMDRALDDARGIRVKFPDFKSAWHMRNRLHHARRIDRDDNRETYKDNPDHPLYGRSAYDGLAVRVRENGEETTIILDKIECREFIVESLGDEDVS